MSRSKLKKVVNLIRFVEPTSFERLNLWLIPVMIEGEKKRTEFNLLLDTGSQITVLTLDVQKIVGIPIKHKNINVSGVGGNSKQKLGTVKNLKIGSISLGALDVGLGLPKAFEKYQIDGILGSDVLRLFSITLNYPMKTITLEKIL